MLLDASSVPIPDFLDKGEDATPAAKGDVPRHALTRRLIRATGAVRDLAQPLTLTEIRAKLGTEVLEGITLVHWGLPLHTMLMREQPGRKNARVNTEATTLYRANSKPGSKRQIRGDVLIVPDQDFTYQLPLE